MTRQKLGKIRPLSSDLLNKIRNREAHICPYCGNSYRLSLFTRLLARDLKPVTCKSCGIVFLLPMSLEFDPAISISARVDSTKGVNCRSCRIGFRVKHYIEQCPCCGQVIRIEYNSEEMSLIDNTAAFAMLIENHQRINS